jgi:tetratricopeptide (TPR) repeat protein
LSDAGFKPWMDKKDILPGEDWESCIQRVIRRSDFFLVCLSINSVSRRGFLQKEIKYALDIWQEKLESDIYLIPARLEDCEVPESLRRFQWVNLFEGDGWTWLVEAIQEGMKRWAPVTRPTGHESTPSEPYSANEGPSPGTEMAMPEEGPERERSEKLTMPEESRMENTSRELYEQGLRHFQNADWQQAIDSFLAVLRLDADYENAVAMLKEAQKEEKLENLYNEGDTYFQQEAWKSAIETFNEIQRINAGYRDIKKKLREAEKREHVRTLYEQGKEYLANEEWQKAIDSFRAVQRQDPDYSNVTEGLRKAEEQKMLQDLYRRGIEYSRQGRWSNAIEMFGELQKAGHNYPDVAAKLEQAEAQQQTERNLSELYDKAKGYEDARDWQDAINAYVDILRINPEYKDVTERLSRINRLRKSSPTGESQKAPPMILRWWNSLTSDGKAAVVLGALGIIVAVIFGIFSTPFLSRWLSSATSSDTPTVASIEAPISTSTLSSTLTITITPTSTPSPTNTPLPPYPAPALVSPIDQIPIPKGQDVKLEWKWEQDLAEDEFFEVRIRLEGEREFGKMNRTKALYQFVPASKVTQTGRYEWQVAIVSRSGEEKVVSQVWSFVVQ